MSNKILDDMRDVMRRRHYSIRTERSYCQWVKRFILHFNMKSCDDLSEGEKKIETYLTFLARDRNVAPSTQNQALITRQLQRLYESPVSRSGVSAHTFRHSFATDLLRRETDIRTIQSLLGHKDVKTIMIYTHILQQGGEGVISPPEDL